MVCVSEDEISTGIDDIDQIGEDNSYTEKLNVALTGFHDFIDNEIVYQSPDGTWANSTAHASVKEWYKANGAMFVYDITGNFSSNTPNTLYGNTSHAQYSVTSITDEKSDYVSFDIFDNKNFDTGADLILDLSETNPFGTP